ncbi:hypothetical protein BDV3_003735 [Batrachochytrium dendrobatidis]
MTMDLSVADTVKAFYDATDALMDITFNAVDPALRVDAFSFILKAAKQVQQVKLMAASVIPKYVSSFPSMVEEAFNTQLDLCEDEDIQIRKESIKNLWGFCKETEQFASSVTDALCQLLQAEQEDELVIIRQTLKMILVQHPNVAFEAVMSQLLNGVPIVRTELLQFLVAYVGTLTLAVELKSKFVTVLIKLASMQSVEPVDTKNAFMLLRLMNAFDTPKHQTEILTMFDDQLGQQLPFSTVNKELIPKLISHANRNLAIYNNGGSSHSLLHIIFTGLVQNGKFIDLEPKQQLNLFKLVADLIPFVRSVDFFKSTFEIVVQAINYLITDDMVTIGQSKIDLMRCEPIVYVLYTCDRQSGHAPITSEKLLARLRALYIETQAAKNAIASQLSAYKAPHGDPANMTKPDRELFETTMRLSRSLRCISNIYLMIMELLKPAHARKLVDLNLSWNLAKSSTTQNTAAKLEPVDKPTSAIEKNNKKRQKNTLNGARGINTPATTSATILHKKLSTAALHHKSNSKPVSKRHGLKSGTIQRSDHQSSLSSQSRQIKLMPMQQQGVIQSAATSKYASLQTKGFEKTQVGSQVIDTGNTFKSGQRHRGRLQRNQVRKSIMTNVDINKPVESTSRGGAQHDHVQIVQQGHRQIRLVD